MSYLGSIGNIMYGSGLKELFCEILAQASAIKALTGHAYARAIRAHLLIQAALTKLIISQINFSEDSMKTLKDLIEKINEENSLDILKHREINNLTRTFLSQMQILKENGPTSQL